MDPISIRSSERIIVWMHCLEGFTMNPSLRNGSYPVSSYALEWTDLRGTPRHRSPWMRFRWLS